MKNSLISFLCLSLITVVFLFPYALGFLNLPLDAVMLLSALLFFGPLVVISLLLFTQKRMASSKILLIWITLTFVAFAACLIGPPNAIRWTTGFAYRLLYTKNPAQIQQWATAVLVKYNNGTLAVKPPAHSWQKEQISGSEIPNSIQDLWWDKPAIEIVSFTPDERSFGTSQTNSDRLLNKVARPVSKRCVNFAWYLTGVLVGPRDFHTTWNPWYIREVIPGIYVYCGMK